MKDSGKCQHGNNSARNRARMLGHGFIMLLINLARLPTRHYVTPYFRIFCLIGQVLRFIRYSGTTVRNRRMKIEKMVTIWQLMNSQSTMGTDLYKPRYSRTFYLFNPFQSTPHYTPHLHNDRYKERIQERRYHHSP